MEFQRHTWQKPLYHSWKEWWDVMGMWLLQNQGNARDKVSYRKLAEIWTADGRTTQHLSGNLKTSQALFIIF